VRAESRAGEKRGKGGTFKTAGLLFSVVDWSRIQGCQVSWCPQVGGAASSGHVSTLLLLLPSLPPRAPHAVTRRLLPPDTNDEAAVLAACQSLLSELRQAVQREDLRGGQARGGDAAAGAGAGAGGAAAAAAVASGRPGEGQQSSKRLRAELAAPVAS